MVTVYSGQVPKHNVLRSVIVTLESGRRTGGGTRKLGILSSVWMVRLSLISAVTGFPFFVNGTYFHCRTMASSFGTVARSTVSPLVDGVVALTTSPVGEMMRFRSTPITSEGVGIMLLKGLPTVRPVLPSTTLFIE